MYKHIEKEEKKLTDEEIVKALDICYNFKGCTNECPYFNKNGRNFCMEDKALYKDLKDLIHRQKAEIERLTEERDMYANDLYWKSEVRKREDFITELTVENDELQKQVDELTVEKAELEAKANDTIEFWMHEYDNAVKDTAKEILTELIEKAHSNGCIDLTVNEVKAWFREDYGVEVE